jgi:hypothetical protein
MKPGGVLLVFPPTPGSTQIEIKKRESSADSERRKSPRKKHKSTVSGEKKHESRRARCHRAPATPRKNGGNKSAPSTDQKKKKKPMRICHDGGEFEEVQLYGKLKTVTGMISN